MDHQDDERVFIRSLAARSHLGGLTRTTRAILDAYGRGALRRGDRRDGRRRAIRGRDRRCRRDEAGGLPTGPRRRVQAIKAGVLEVADILVVNKSDMPLAAPPSSSSSPCSSCPALGVDAARGTHGRHDRRGRAGIARRDRAAPGVARRAQSLVAMVEFRVPEGGAHHDPRRGFELADIEARCARIR
jgi:hypothetical protein